MPAPPPGAGSGGPGVQGLRCRRDDLLQERPGPASPHALRFVPTGSHSPTATSTPGSAPKLTRARRGGAALPRLPPTPGRGRPASCPGRGCRGEVPGRGQSSELGGAVAVGGPWESPRVTSSCTPTEGRGARSPASAARKAPAKVGFQQQSLPQPDLRAPAIPIADGPSYRSLLAPRVRSIPAQGTFYFLVIFGWTC